MTECAYVALGANLGDRETTLRAAMDQLREHAESDSFIASSIWETEPVGCPPGSPRFCNAAVSFATSLSAEEVLHILHEIERSFGRLERVVRNEPRLLDLDLVALGAETRSGPAFFLPHPRAHERAFVLLPLEEIAPDFVLPNQNRSIQSLVSGLAPSERELVQKTSDSGHRG